MVKININNFKNKTDSKKRYTEREVDRVLSMGVKIIETGMKADAPVDTGFLRMNISSNKVREGTYRLKSKADYSRFQENLQSSRGRSFWHANLKRGIDYININLKRL